MRILLFLILTVESSKTTDVCTDDPVFQPICKIENCNFEESRQKCEETCGFCTGARSADLFGNRLFEEGQQCDTSVANILKCDHACIIRNNKPTCECFKGYNLQYDKTSCRDIDECKMNPCPLYEKCKNHPGGYSCERVNKQNCQVGSSRDNFGGCCQSKDEFKCGIIKSNLQIPPKLENFESNQEWPWLVFVLGMFFI